MERFPTGERIEAVASTARESARKGSDIIDVRIYVRDVDHPMGGEIIALDTSGSPLRQENGREIAVPLSDHGHIGPVVQQIVDIVQQRRAARGTAG